MRVLLRILGCLPLLFGLLGFAIAAAGPGKRTVIPSLEAHPWTEPLRAQADYALALLFVVVGLQLVRGRAARGIAWATLLLALARWLFDLVAADATTARGRTILHGDLAALAAALLALVLSLGTVKLQSGRSPGRGGAG